MAAMTMATRPPTIPPPRLLAASSQRRIGRWLALIFVGIVAVGIARVAKRRGKVTELRIATGQQGGTFLPFGEELAATINRENPRMRARALESPGSPFSVDMLDRKEVELALVANNTQRGAHIRLIAPLYPETLQIIVRTSAKIEKPRDLMGKRIVVGLAKSGTETVAWQVLEHFGMTRDRVKAVNLSPMEGASKLEAAESDAMFVLAGLRAPIVDRLLSQEGFTLLSLGEPGKVGGPLDGIQVDAPFLLPSVVPERTYGDKPAEPVGTMGVKALLVVRDDIDEGVVYDLTQSLFTNKLRLAQREKLLSHLSEKFDEADSPYPLHPGAHRYLRRNEPSLLEQNTDFVSLIVTLTVLLFSGVTALRSWRRRSQRGRIEVYFQNVAELTTKMREATSVSDFDVLLTALNETESKALRELASERLEANESFRVLQEALRALQDDLLRARSELR